MKIVDILWLEEIIDKLAWKHNLQPDEVEDVIWSRPHFRFIAKGRRHRDEHVYAAFGQTGAGRYLTVFFIHKRDNMALIVSARDMDQKERRRYGRK